MKMGDLANAFDVPEEQSTNVGWANRLGEILTARPQYDETVQYKTASPLVNITEGDIGRATEAAMGVSGGGMKVETPKGIRAYHSSPYDFDKFDLAKIGTGEGAQAYGHGLYFAENPAVSGQGGQYWDQFVSRFGGPESTAAKELQFHGFDRAKAAENMRSRIMYPDEALPEDVLKRQLALRQEALKLLEGDKPVGPRTYEVNINADPARFMQWDQPLPERGALSESVDKIYRDAFQARRLPADTPSKYGFTGNRIYKDLADVVPGKARASETLLEGGIPGIKYLDQGSRVGPVTGQKISQIEGKLKQAREDLAGGFGDPERMARMVANLEHELSLHKPTSNYVIFDPNIIDITKKYAVPGALTAGGMGALAAQDEYSQ